MVGALIQGEWEKAKDEEKRKLQRERMVLNKQSRAMLKLPTKKDRAEVLPCKHHADSLCLMEADAAMRSPAICIDAQRRLNVPKCICKPHGN